MNRGVLVSRGSPTIRRLFARRLDPVSVTSTIASASRGGLTSVAPQLNSTLALTPCEARHRRGKSTNSVAMRFPSRSFGDWTGESLGTQRTHLTGRLLTLL